MKHLIIPTLLTVVMHVSVYSQTTTFFPASNSIWVEDFAGYTNETGITVNSGAITDNGDYNNTFTKWQINSTGVSTSNTIIASVQNSITNVYAPSFNVANTGGELEWESEEIDVSAFDQNHLSVVLENEGNISDSEYIDIYWKIVNVGNYILIDDESLGHTIVGTSSEECWRTKKIFKDLTVTNPGKVQIKVVFKSTDIANILKLKKVEILGRDN